MASCKSNGGNSLNETNSATTFSSEKCSNCKRENAIKFHTSGFEHLSLDFKRVKRMEIKQRSKFRFTASSRTSSELVVLCSECFGYLTTEDGAKYVNMWPSFL